MLRRPVEPKRYVTVPIDLTGIRDGTGPARLLDMVEGRSKQAFKTWLAARPQAWRDAVEVVGMDGFTGFKPATSEELPDAVAMMDPYPVVRLAGEALDTCRRRIQQDTCGHRGRTADPLYGARRTLQTVADLLTDKQKTRLEVLFAVDAHGAVEVTWSVYQQMVGAYRHPDRNYFDRPGTSNGPNETINGRLEHLRGRTLGFRNLTNYIARSLLEAGGLGPRLHPRLSIALK